MSEETALAAVEYLLANSSASPYAALGFYGGEPFLAFPLVKRSVEYLKRAASGRAFVSVTTNGTRFSEEIVEWCVNEDISLLVSLDGSASTHEANRTDSKGVGSWSQVMQGLERLHEANPEYFKRKVGVSCTIPCNASPLQAARFFSSARYSHLFSSLRMNATMEVLRNRTTQRPIYPFFDSEYATLLQMFISALLDGTIEDESMQFIRALFQRPFHTLYRRVLYSTSSGQHIPLNGMCIPGGRKLYVSVDGRLFPCERAGTVYALGDVGSGVDISTVWKLLREYYSHNERRCTHCWCVRLCSACLASIQGPAGLDYKVARRHCRTERKSWARRLAIFSGVLVTAPTAFDYLENYVVGDEGIRKRYSEKNGADATSPQEGATKEFLGCKDGAKED